MWWFLQSCNISKRHGTFCHTQFMQQETISCKTLNFTVLYGRPPIESKNVTLRNIYVKKGILSVQLDVTLPGDLYLRFLAPGLRFDSPRDSGAGSSGQITPHQLTEAAGKHWKVICYAISSRQALPNVFL